MVMFTRKIHRKPRRHFTFLILTDRDDLETQTHKIKALLRRGGQ
jgi:type I restriction enzyme R subunit